MTKSKSILMINVMVDAIKELEGRTKALEATERNVLAELRAQEITLGIVSKRVLGLSKALLGMVKNLKELATQFEFHIKWPFCHKER